MKKIYLKKLFSFENMHYNLFSCQDFSSQPIQKFMIADHCFSVFI